MARGRVPFLAGSPLLVLLLFSACAKVGEPQPPTVYVAQPSQDLSCKQVSDQVILSVSIPGLNTNGTRVNDLRAVEVFRIEEGLAEASGPISKEHFLKEGIKILSVPEDEFPKYKQGNKFVFSDTLRFHEDVDIYSKRRVYSVRFLNKKGQTAGLGNQAALVPVPIPAPPEILSPEITQNEIRLRWVPPTENLDGSKPARILGYNVYRSTNLKEFPVTPINPQLLQQPEYDDRGFEFDKDYVYAVSVVASERNPLAESSLSKELHIIPKDTFPPNAPGNLNAVVENGVVVLLWVPPADADVDGYKVYRSDNGSTERIPLNAELIRTFSYRDQTVQKGRTYIYAVTAIDKHNNESAAASTTVEIH